MNNLSKECIIFLEKFEKVNNIDKELVENFSYNLNILEEDNKEISNLIFNNIKNNINYPINYFIALNDFIKNLINNNYEEIDKMLNNTLSKKYKYYTRDDLWETIDKDLRKNGIDGDYLQLRDYLHFEERYTEIFKFKNNKVSYLSDNIEKDWYDKNDYLENVFKENSNLYIQKFLNKIEKQYQKNNNIESSEINY